MIFAVNAVIVTNIVIPNFGKTNHSLLRYLQLKEPYQCF